LNPIAAIGEGLHLLGGSSDNAGEKTAALNQQIADATKRQQDYLAAIQGTQSELLALSGGELGLEAAESNVTKAQDALNIAIYQHGANSQEAADATLNLRQAQESAAVAALGLDDTTSKLTQQIGGNKDATDALIDKLKIAQLEHPKEAAAIQVEIDKLVALRDSIFSVPGSHNTTITGDFGQLAYAVQAAKNILSTIPTSVSTSILGSAGALYGGGAGVLQTGGPVRGGLGQPVPIIAHGGEYVLSADVVQRIKAGRQSEGAVMAGAAREAIMGSSTGPTTLVVPVIVDGREITRVVIDNINSSARTGGPVIHQRAIAS
jgi:hypothetical protein